MLFDLSSNEQKYEHCVFKWIMWAFIDWIKGEKLAKNDENNAKAGARWYKGERAWIACISILIGQRVNAENLFVSGKSSRKNSWTLQNS